MKIISFILAVSVLMTGCASKHKSESANSNTKKTDNNTTAANPKPAETPASPPAPVKDMYKCTSEVSMRLAAAPTARVLMKIMQGESVEVLEKTNADWWKIKYRDDTGYALSKTLSK